MSAKRSLHLLIALLLLLPLRAAGHDLAPPLGLGGSGGFLGMGPISGPTACHLRGTFLLRPSTANPDHQQPAVALGGQGALSCSLLGYVEAGVSLWGIWDAAGGPGGWGPVDMWMRIGPFYPASRREAGFLVAPFLQHAVQPLNQPAAGAFYQNTDTYGAFFGWHKDRVEISVSAAYQRGEDPATPTYQGVQVGASLWLRTFDALQLGAEALYRGGCAPGDTGPACTTGLWWTVGLRLLEKHGVGFGLAYGRGHLGAAPSQQGQLRLGFSIGPHHDILSGPSWLDDVIGGVRDLIAARRARAKEVPALAPPPAKTAPQVAAKAPPPAPWTSPAPACDVARGLALRTGLLGPVKPCSAMRLDPLRPGPPPPHLPVPPLQVRPPVLAGGGPPRVPPRVPVRGVPQPGRGSPAETELRYIDAEGNAHDLGEFVPRLGYQNPPIRAPGTPAPPPELDPAQLRAPRPEPVPEPPPRVWYQGGEAQRQQVEAQRPAPSRPQYRSPFAPTPAAQPEAAHTLPEVPERPGEASRPPPPPAPPEPVQRGSQHPVVRRLSGVGNHFHSSHPGQGQDQLRERYDVTEMEFTRPGKPGPDVHITGGKHPSEYPGSAWPKGVDYGDFKPDTPGGRKTFQRDQRTKWPMPVHMIPYDPNIGRLK